MSAEQGTAAPGGGTAAGAAAPAGPAVAASSSSSASAGDSISAAAPLVQQSLLGDVAEWEHTVAPDVDIDDDETAEDVQRLALALGSEAAAAAERLAKLNAAAAAAAKGGSKSAAGGAAAFATFVKESGELASLLPRLPYESAAPTRLCEILDGYQEQGELLDPHLPHVITSLMNYVHAIIRPGKRTPVPPPNSTTGAIKEGEEDRAAADAYTPTGPACSQEELLTRVFKVIYALAKVRGYKTILHFFPHEVADLEPTLALLAAQDRLAHATWETRYGLLLWLSIIVLIPFDLTTVDSSMGNEVAKAVTAATAAGDSDSSGSHSGEAPRGIISALISLGSSYLSDTGPPREAAAVMLAKLFSRVDMHAHHLAAFFRWSTAEIARVSAEQQQGRVTARSVFLLTGIFKALTEIFRHAPRDVLLKHVQLVYEPVLQNHEHWSRSTNTLLRKLFVKLAQRVGLTYLPVRVAAWRYQRGHRSLLNTLQGSATEGGASAPVPHNPALGSQHAAPASAPSSSPVPAASSSDADDLSVPSEIETLVQILLDGLRDRDTIVRWSSAKGIGRITNLLSADFGDDVVQATLELFSGRESDAAWHGGCLALAELARRGLLLPARLETVVPITLRALSYDVRTASHSVGSNVRDAACYVIWAFARAYAPEVMAPYVSSLGVGILPVCVFDREVNVRRASSAAFQEHVGRQGSGSFVHGMAILQLADYFTLSTRSHAYRVVAFQVAQFEAYTLALIEHLLTRKVGHWDKEIRVLTAQTLGILAKRNDKARDYMRDVVVKLLLQTAAQSTDLVEKHGALLALAAILLALHEQNPRDYLPLALRMDVCRLISTLTGPAQAATLNGRGGQIMREALCALLESVARVDMLWTSGPQALALLRPFQTVLDDNLAHTNEEVSSAAVRAVGPWVRAHYEPREGVDDAKVAADKLARARPVMDHYTRTLLHPSSLAGATRGFAAALGTLPRRLLTTTTTKALEVFAAAKPAATTVAAAGSAASATPAPAAPSAPLPSFLPPSASSLIYQPLSRILQALILSAAECTQGDAETRRNSVQALVRLVDTMTEEDLMQFMPPVQVPPVATVPAAGVASAAGGAAAAGGAGSAALSAAREKEQKLALKAAKSRADALNKYWHRDLSLLGLGPHASRVAHRIATCLLVCLDDYATDNRGDVGSWVREAAMLGLEKLVNKLAAMHHKSRNASEAGEAVDVFPPLLSARLFPALLKQAAEKIDRVRECAGQIFFRMLWAGTSEANAAAASAAAAAATAAGASSLVASSAAEIPFIPARDELRRRFPWHRPSASGSAAVSHSSHSTHVAWIDWSSPTQTFPLLVPLLSLRLSESELASASSSCVSAFPYQRALLSGLLISVGGLSESVVKSSSEAFLAFVGRLSAEVSEGGEGAQGALALLRGLAEELLAILLQEKGHARVVVPAFKTLELLLSQGLLESLDTPDCSFARSLQQRVWKEVGAGASANIHKLMAAIPVLVGLLAFREQGALRQTILACLLSLLGHAAFPKVRRLTAEALYNCLIISADELVPGAEEDPDAAQPVLDALANTAWDGPLPPAEEQAKSLHQLLQVEPIVAKKSTKAGAGRAGGAAAAAAAARTAGGDISALSNEYSSLVRHIGY